MCMPHGEHNYMYECNTCEHNPIHDLCAIPTQRFSNQTNNTHVNVVSSEVLYCVHVTIESDPEELLEG